MVGLKVGLFSLATQSAACFLQSTALAEEARASTAIAAMTTLVRKCMFGSSFPVSLVPGSWMNDSKKTGRVARKGLKKNTDKNSQQGETCKHKEALTHTCTFFQAVASGYLCVCAVGGRRRLAKVAREKGG